MRFFPNNKGNGRTNNYIKRGWNLIGVISILLSAIEGTHVIMAVTLAVYFSGIVVIYFYGIFEHFIYKLLDYDWYFSRQLVLKILGILVVPIVILYFYYKPISEKRELITDNSKIRDTDLKNNLTQEDTTKTKEIVKVVRERNWNDFVQGNDSCLINPMKVIEVRGATAKQIAAFLQNVPPVPEGKKIRSHLINGSYRFKTYKYKLDKWNQKAESYYKSLSPYKLSQYKRNLQNNINGFREWKKIVVPNNMKYEDKRCILETDFEPNCPRIVLYHSFKDPFENNKHWSKRHHTYEYHEFHVYWFRSSDLFDTIVPN